MWKNFNEGPWQQTIDVRDFIQKNYTAYEGNHEFLEEKTENTQLLWQEAENLIYEEIKKGIIDIETDCFSGIDNFKPGYLNKERELIVGYQTDAPLKRIMNPYGGFRMVENSLKAYDYKAKEGLMETFKDFRKTHNEGVFDAYTEDMKSARSAGLLTGLPDAYGRGRIIGDYRRIALYGVDKLIEAKRDDYKNLSTESIEKTIQLREEVSEQIRALQDMKSMAKTYGYDISVPATTAQEAIQYIYFGYLAAIKENNGAAMSLGRNTAFIDIYIERDLKAGLLTESAAQELIDQLVIKLRMARHLRTPEYNELFAGDPNWVTEAIGGMSLDGRSQITKTAYRFLHTLTTLDPAPEPNMTVLWSESLPENFKKYCGQMSMSTGAIQYENDDLMRPLYGDDYGIACCVSAMAIGKQMQFFGARTNLAKALLYAINGGVDELKTDKSGKAVKVMSGIEPIMGDVLNYNDVIKNYDLVLEKLAKLYVDTMNTIHYMHDKYAYEKGQMALHDTTVERTMAFGVAGVSLVADSLSAIKFGRVEVIRNEQGIAVDFKATGDFPKYGNDNDEVDQMAVELVSKFSSELKKHPTYRESIHTLSVLTITSNVVYGKKTGSTPDGRKVGEPFAPGANPMHGRDTMGALASLNSVAKLPYKDICQDGISNTFSIVPEALGKAHNDKIVNLVNILDGYFSQGAFHLNVNVLTRQLLEDAIENPDKYPTLTIRVSGYAVHFNRLTEEQKREVMKRTFHKSA